jgi:predicted dehydrogenase
MKSNLKAAVIGLGVGETHIIALQSHPNCQVVAICDLDEETLREVSPNYPSCRPTNEPNSVLDDPSIDLICIASYDDAHEPQVIRALRNNKHVFVEKPLCLSIEELENISSEINSRPHLYLSSNHILRKTPRFIELKERIDANQLGEIFHLEGSYDYGRLHKLTDGWRGRISNYSVTLGGGIHIVDLMLWLSGKKVIQVYGKGNFAPTSKSSFDGLSLTTSTLQFDDGTTAQITSNYASVAPHHHKLCIYGTEGTFEQSHSGTSYFWSRDPLDKPEEVISAYPGAAKGDLIVDFIDSILSSTLPIVSKQEVFDAMSVCLAIDQSIASGSPQVVNYQTIL